MTQSIVSAAEARIAWVSSARCGSTDPDELFVRREKRPRFVGTVR